MQADSAGSVATLPTAHPWRTVLAIGGAAAFLLFGYEFVRSVSTSLFIGAYGAKHLPVVMALGPVGTILIVYMYGFLLSRLGPERALLATSAISAVVIVLCYVALRQGFALAAGVSMVASMDMMGLPFRAGRAAVRTRRHWWGRRIRGRPARRWRGRTASACRRRGR